VRSRSGGPFPPDGRRGETANHAPPRFPLLRQSERSWLKEARGTLCRFLRVLRASRRATTPLLIAVRVCVPTVLLGSLAPAGYGPVDCTVVVNHVLRNIDLGLLPSRRPALAMGRGSSSGRVMPGGDKRHPLAAGPRHFVDTGSMWDSSLEVNPQSGLSRLLGWDVGINLEKLMFQVQARRGGDPGGPSVILRFYVPGCSN
jgi:hypothetical protein